MKFALVLLLPLVLAACSNEAQIISGTQDTPDTMKDMSEHMGCQEGEIDKNGDCSPATDKNVQLFDQDLTGKVVTQDLSGDVQGFLAEPSTPGAYPGLLVIHEWWGLNENIKEMAKLLANEGYVVLAIDLYDGQVATDSSTAGQLAGSVRSNPEKAIAHMQAANVYLRERGATQVGSLGWCFGGQQSLQASLNDDFDATVIYYGQLTDDRAQLQNLNGPVLGVFGAEDGSIPVDSVRNFESALNELGIKNEIQIYEGVGHAFANPSGTNYAPDETIDAWEKTVSFLDTHLKA